MQLYQQYRDYIYLGVALYGSIAYFFFDNKVVALNVSASFLLGDIILNKEFRPDIILHHALSSFSVATYAYYKYNNYLNMFIVPPLGFQVSTVFLCINSIYYSSIIQLLFIVTFIYFRIYRHYIDTIIHPDFELFSKEYTNLMILPYIFYSLNLYWLCFIIKKVIKSLKLKYKDTEWILQYLLCLNIPITLYKYIRTNNTYILIDVAGHIFLSIGNYKYHNNLLLNYEYNAPLEMNSFLYDHIGIRAHAALTLTTYCIINNNYNVLYASVINHICSSIVTLYMTQHKEMIEFSQLKIKIINWLQINILMDSLILAYMYHAIFKMYILILLMGIVYKYQIFYHYSHLIFHVLLICQNCLIYSFCV
jgi:hypothetical protein